MSGPKVSVYTLTPEQRAAILAEQQRRRLELEKRQELLSELKNVAFTLDRKLGQLSQYRLIADLSNEHRRDSSLIDRIQDIDTRISQIKATALVSRQETDNARLEHALNSCILSLKRVSDDISELQRLAGKAEDMVTDSLSSQISSFFSSRAKANSSEKIDQFHETIDSLDSIYSCAYLPASLKKRLDSVMARLRTGDQVGDAFIQLEVFPILREYSAFKSLWDKYGEEYQALYRRYESLLVELNNHLPEMIPFSSEAIAKLKQLIADAEKKAQHAAEQAYISQALDDVMVEMGYPLWGQRDVTKRSGKHFRNELYRYSPTSAVNITYADDGQITMEIGKIDTVDRLPSSEETSALVDSMRSFCTDFMNIESRLASRGVVVRDRIALLPPSDSHAQIINLSDFVTVNQHRTNSGRKRLKTVIKPLEIKHDEQS